MGMLPELRARAITVSGITSFDVLARVREEISTVHAGANWDDAKKKIVEEIHPFLADPEDPENTAAAERRAETLLRTHGFQASQAAAFRSINEQKAVFPYVEYHSMDDDRVRDTHMALDGLVFPFDSPLVHSHWCPWDYGCRCHWVPISEDDAHDIRKRDAKLPPDQRTLIEGQTLDHLQISGHLVRGVNQIADVRTPVEKNGPTAYSFNPQDLHIPIDKIQGRYDNQTWSEFEKWSRATSVGGNSKLTVWEWMSGSPIIPPGSLTTLPPPSPAKTMAEILSSLGLDRKLQWEADDIIGIRKALVKDNGVAPSAKLHTVAGNNLLKKGQGSEEWVKKQFAEILSFLPKEVAEALPPLRIEINREDGGSLGSYCNITKTVRVGRKTCLRSFGKEKQFTETLWHEIMHWIHFNAPQSYKDTIAAHFKERTLGEKYGPLSGYGSKGKRDKWWDAYAGRIYKGASYDTDEGVGIELPTRYFQLLANPENLLHQRDPIINMNAAAFDETLWSVLSIFTGEHTT